MSKITETVAVLARPVAESHGCTLWDVEYVKEAAGNDIDIIYGVAINDSLGESIIVTVIATGFELPTQKTYPNTAILGEKRETEEKPQKEETVEVLKDDEILSFFKNRI